MQHSTKQRAKATMGGLFHQAGFYDRLAGRLLARLYRRVASDVAGAGLMAQDRMLDVGTGPGRLPVLIAVDAATGVHIDAIDLLPEMIEQARHRAHEEA